MHRQLTAQSGNAYGMRFNQFAQLVEVAVAARWPARATMIACDVLSKIGLALDTPHLPIAVRTTQVQMNEFFDGVRHCSPIQPPRN